MNPKPRAFEPRRLLQALREHRVRLLAVAALALFGGALVGRLAVPSQQLAQAVARIVREPHAVFARALAEDVIERALRKTGLTLAISEVRERTRIGFEGRDRLTVQVRAGAEEGELARRLADGLAETYVTLANERLDQADFEARRVRAAQTERARADDARADDALSAALAREGVPDLIGELASARAELAALEGEAASASVDANAEQERAAALHELSPREPARSSPEALASAQRELSRKLALGAPVAELTALRARLQALQKLPAARDRGALQQEAEARAQAVRARGLSQRATQKRAELLRLEQSEQRVAPLLLLREEAHARWLALQAQTPEVRARLPRSSVAQHAALSPIDRHGLRWFVSLLAPLLALGALALFYLLHRLPD